MNLENNSFFCFCSYIKTDMCFLSLVIHTQILIARFPESAIINSKYNNNYFDLAKGIPIENFSN